MADEKAKSTVLIEVLKGYWPANWPADVVKPETGKEKLEAGTICHMDETEASDMVDKEIAKLHTPASAEKAKAKREAEKAEAAVPRVRNIVRRSA